MKARILCLVMFFILGSCVYQQIEPIKIPKPKEPQETENLVAPFQNTVPLNSNDPFWAQSDYKVVGLSDVITGETNSEDGIMNVSGTFEGLASFNEGNEPALILKAAHDDENIYVLVSWQDNSLNVSQRNWYYNGPEDPLKGDDPAGWTSQRSDDNLVLEFDMGGGMKDIWKWSFALSEPLGFAVDMFSDGTVDVDEGDKLFSPNMAGEDFRSGPMYEWDGVQQELTRDIGGFTILDPAYYLLNKTEFTGDMANGNTLYQSKCARCHGIEGDGKGYDWETGVGFTISGAFNRVPRTGFEPLLGVSSHSGQTYWDQLSESEKTDVISVIRGFSGVPGYYLENSNGSNSDVAAHSNIQLAKIVTVKDNPDGYQVMLSRKLDTGNLDDILLEVNSQFSFNIYLADNDELNRIGATNLVLELK